MKDVSGITLRLGDKVRSPALGAGVVGFVTEFNEIIVPKNLPPEIDREQFYERKTITVSTIETLTRCLTEITLAPYNFEIIG